MKKIFKTIVLMLEAAAEARAATVAARMGRHLEARNILMGKQKS